MNEFLAASFSYPTIVFTTLLGIAVFYWLLTLVGVVGLDSLDLDLDLDADLDADGGELLAAAGFWHRQPIRLIPPTISLTIFFFIGWFICHVISMYFGAGMNQVVPQWLWGSVMLLFAVFVSALITNIIASPLAPVFQTHHAPKKKDLLGRIVEIRTSRVDDKFGSATAEDGGAGLIVEVRCTPGKLSRGDRALVIDYDAKGEFYNVEPLDEVMKG